jgi:antitoxin HicB
MNYIAKIAREGDRWLVAFPDCPGCQTFGRTKEQAIEMAREALEGWLETGLLHGDVPPRPRPHRGVPIRVRSRLDVAIQIRWLRAELGLTQAALAKRVGVTQQQIAKLENPDANPTIATLDAVTSGADAQLVVHIAPRRAASARKSTPRRRRAA